MASLSDNHNQIIKDLITYFDASIVELESIQLEFSKALEPSLLFVRIKNIADECIEMIQKLHCLDGDQRKQLTGFIRREFSLIDPHNSLKVFSLQMALDHACIRISRPFPIVNDYREVVMPEVSMPIASIVSAGTILSEVDKRDSVTEEENEQLIVFQSKLPRLNVDNLDIDNKVNKISIGIFLRNDRGELVPFF